MPRKLQSDGRCGWWKDPQPSESSGERFISHHERRRFAIESQLIRR
jgi:hypothetical protein